MFGPTRYHAFLSTNDGKDLAALLVRNSLARIYGTRTPALIAGIRANTAHD